MSNNTPYAERSLKDKAAASRFETWEHPVLAMLAHDLLEEVKALKGERDALTEQISQAIVKADILADLAADSTEMLIGQVGIVSGLNDLGDHLAKSPSPQGTEQ